MVNVGSDFTGVGAFEQALIRLNIAHNVVFACDLDQYVQQTYLHNYGAPGYFVPNVYDRPIPKNPLDIYMTSPPCQAFSFSGKRDGEDDERGVLFYNSHAFIKKNKPRYFIFENVKGLLSDDKVNKKDEMGRTFRRWLDFLGGKSVNGNPVIFPHEESVPYHIYFQVLNAKDYGVPQNRERVFIIGIRDDSDNNFSFPKTLPIQKTIKDILEPNVDKKYYLSKKYIEDVTFNGKTTGVVADLNKGGQKGTVFSEDSLFISCLAASDYKQPKQIIGAFRGRDPLDPRNRKKGAKLVQTLEFSSEVVSNTLTSVLKDNVVFDEGKIRRLTVREYFRLMDFPDSFMDNLFVKKELYFRFVYSKFDKNKKAIKWNAKLQVVKENQILENLETYVLCTTKEWQKLEQLKTSFTKIKSKGNLLNVNFAIEKLEDGEPKECVINITKWTGYMETLYMLMKEGKNQVVVDISETKKEIKSTEKLWKITLEENLCEEKLYITLILLRQIMQSKIFTYAKTPVNTQRYISSTIDLEKGLENLQLLFLKMEYTKQLISDSSLYKQAGNSIVVSVLYELLKKLKL